MMARGCATYVWNWGKRVEWATAESVQPAKSSFVTVVAWIFIALDGLASFVGLVQNIVVNMVFPFDQLLDGIAKAQTADRLPPWFGSLVAHIRLFLFVMLVYSVIKLAAAIGLLNRRNWARLLFIGILGLGVAWSFFGILLQQYFVSSMMTMPMPRNAPQDFNAMMEGMMIAIRAVSALFAIGFAVLYVWMIRKLMSPAIVAEFA